MKKIQHTENIFEYESFLSKDECQLLIDGWNSQDDWDLTCFYNAYVISGKKEIEANFKEKIYQMYDSFKKIAEESFNCDLKPLSQSAHKWTVGAYAADHADNADLDGTPNGWAANKLVTILYLNDQYDGGYLTFRDHDIAIKPKTGTLMVFDVGINNVHAVTEVKSGIRYTMLNSFDYIDSHYDIDLEQEKLKEEKAKADLRLEWQDGKIDPSSATLPKMVY
jgi:hypothetical protein